MNDFDVVVVGSCMIDLICYAPRLPKSGETLCGSKFTMGYGGKGCNQCVAAKKLGAKAALIARLGNDTFGKNYNAKLQEYGMPLKHVKMTEDVSTGMAQITVAASGENQIVIVLGANEKLTESDVIDAKEVIVNAKILVCQMEISETSTLKALQLKAESKRGKSILNVAPALQNINSLFYTLPDIFCVNESEAEILTGIEITNTRIAEEAVLELLSRGCKSVIITLGEMGAVYGEKGKPNLVHVPAIKVDAIDTTGAGDAFIGGLAFYLSSYPDLEMKEAIKKASEVAAISVQKLGTQESFPGLTELPNL